ncbi:hypothetical protein AWC23_01910 [Mycobacterium saskatchewanense]|uniref:Proline and glycine rich transmembrane protein n=1 Tax=Mycobacterium saskatchewanense TaxID=220927 RepID=A0AAJ3NLR1_9MYCO|nr:hypothetical protein AWC23_01910 [Mycobacterium saskatchewanense]
MPLVVATLVYGVLIAIAMGVVGLGQSMGTTTTTSDDDSFSFNTNVGPAGMAVMALGYLIVAVVGALAESAYLSGCFDIADGRAVTIGSFYKPRNFGMVLLASLIVVVLTGIASALCFLPGLILGIFVQFTIPFVIDRSQSAITGLTSSFSTVASNFGNALLVWLVGFALVFVGALACGVGLLVAAPVASLILVYAFRKLTGGQVAPLERQGHQAGPPPGMPPYPAG